MFKPSTLFLIHLAGVGLSGVVAGRVIRFLYSAYFAHDFVWEGLVEGSVVMVGVCQCVCVCLYIYVCKYMSIHVQCMHTYIYTFRLLIYRCDTDFTRTNCGLQRLTTAGLPHQRPVHHPLVLSTTKLLTHHTSHLTSQRISLEKM